MNVNNCFSYLFVNFIASILCTASNLNDYADITNNVFGKDKYIENYRSLTNSAIKNVSVALPETNKSSGSVSLSDVETYVKHTDPVLLKEIIVNYLSLKIVKRDRVDNDGRRQDSRKYLIDQEEKDFKVFGKEDNVIDERKIQRILREKHEKTHDLPVWNGTFSFNEMEPSRRIMRGFDASINHYGFMVSIHRRNKFWCAGVLVRKDFVLTTASCLQYEYNNRFYKERPMLITVRAGCNFTDPDDKKEDEYSRRRVPRSPVDDVTTKLKSVKKRKKTTTIESKSSYKNENNEMQTEKLAPKRQLITKGEGTKNRQGRKKKRRGKKRLNLEPVTDPIKITKTTSAKSKMPISKLSIKHDSKPSIAEIATTSKLSVKTEKDWLIRQEISDDDIGNSITTTYITESNSDTEGTTIVKPENEETEIKDKNDGKNNKYTKGNINNNFTINTNNVPINDTMDDGEDSTNNDSFNDDINVQRGDEKTKKPRRHTICNQFRALEFFFHPAYDPSTLDFNFALIRLEYRYMYAYNHTMLIALPPTDGAVPETAKVFILGWGSNVPDGSMNTRKKRLQMALLPIYTNSECAERYGKEFVHANMFCAGTVSEHTAGCNHDMGGAAVNKQYLVGLFSSGPMFCGETDSPNIFARAGAAKTWVERIIASVPRNAYIKPANTSNHRTFFFDDDENVNY